MSCISFLNTCPASGDTEQQLLSKILQVINTTGGGIAGVSSLSVNGGAPQTGAVSITTGGTVTSVNGDPGPAVSLDSGEIPEGANLYFTETRVRATVLTGFASALGAITAADSILSAFGKTQGRLAALEAGTAGPFLLKAGDTGTGAFLFTPSADNVVPLTLTTTVGSATTSNNLVVNYGATNLLTLRNDGRFTLAGRIVATTTSVLGHAINFSDAGTNNAPLALAIAHTSTAGLGTAAAGFGTMLDFNLDSTTTLATRATRQTVAWTDATHATRTASTTFFAFTSGVETTQLTLTNNQVQGGDGTVALPTFTSRNAPTTGHYFPTATSIAGTLGGTEATRLTTTSFASASAFALGATSATPDVFLRRDAAAILALSNTTVAAQTFRITETTDAGLANYSRTTITTQAGNHLLRTEAAGTGTLRTLQVGTGPATGTNIAGVPTIAHGGQSTGSATGGDFQIQTSPAGGAGIGVNALATVVTVTGTARVGINSASPDQALSVNVATGTSAISLRTAGGTRAFFGVSTAADDPIVGMTAGDMGIRVQANDFMVSADSGVTPHLIVKNSGLIAFHGQTSSFPGLKRSSAQLHCRLADDSADAVFQALQLNVAGTKVVGAQGAAVADASGGTTIDAEARTALNALLARLRTHGLIAT